MALPKVRPSSGSFFGPKRSSARIKINTVSCHPSGPIEFLPPVDSTPSYHRRNGHYRDMPDDCQFCRIAARTHPAAIVFEDGRALAFLDNRPLFPGHCLLIPKAHRETLSDIPSYLIGCLFSNTQLLARAIETGL